MGRGPSRIRTGDGGFAIRCHDAATIDEPNSLGQPATSEVPTVVPSFSEPPSALHLSPELKKLVEAWPNLPQVVKAGILAMIDAAAGSRTGQ